jgi:hypothetical protein
MRGLKGLAGEDAELRDKIAAHMDKTLTDLDAGWKKRAAEFGEALSTGPAEGGKRETAEAGDAGESASD